jgi:scyllo-inositol 2-dehydrogenase (NADP+)
MKKINLALIGAGNIMSSRHLPALDKSRQFFNIVGIIDSKKKQAGLVAKKYNIPHFEGYSKKKDINKIEWLNEVEAAIIATPPKRHAEMVDIFLNMGKHVLVEKPFVTDLKEGARLIKLAEDKNLVLAVNHNFQFSAGFKKLWDVTSRGGLGEIRSVYGVQFSNDTRRLPKWAEDLPYGLFYDESPHFFYLVKKVAKGNIKLKNVFVEKSELKPRTPKIINLSLDVGDLPITIYLNFESPICEWYFCVFGEKNFACVDLFRDIFIMLPNDRQHLGKEVFRTSILASLQHWRGVLSNGLRYSTGRLLWGFDVAHEKFYKAIVSGRMNTLDGIRGLEGLKVNRMQYEVIHFKDKARK